MTERVAFADPAAVAASELTPVETRLPHLADAICRTVDTGLEFHVASNESLRPHLKLMPFGHAVSWLDFTRAQRLDWDVKQFLDLFNVMNGIAFGDRGIPMPRWVVIDLILVPSAALVATVSQDVFATAIEHHAPGSLTGLVSKVFDDARRDGYTGPVPVGGYCAAPSAAPGLWTGWSLWSLLPGVGLGLAAKALALATYRAERLDGVTQYDNPALKVHTRFGTLRIKVAAVPFHTSPASFIYQNDFTGTAVPADAEPTFLLDPADVGRQQVMQQAIEAGTAEYHILPPGHLVHDGRTVVPILEVSRR